MGSGGRVHRLSMTHSVRQRNLMMHFQCPLRSPCLLLSDPPYNLTLCLFSQILLNVCFHLKHSFEGDLFSYENNIYFMALAYFLHLKTPWKVFCCISILERNFLTHLIKILHKVLRDNHCSNTFPSSLAFCKVWSLAANFKGEWKPITFSEEDLCQICNFHEIWKNVSLLFINRHTRINNPSQTAYAAHYQQLEAQMLAKSPVSRTLRTNSYLRLVRWSG